MKRLIKLLIKIYQKTISPLFPNSCRFYPTCSNYAIEAIEKHGIFYGAILAFKRIIRCNPFNAGGFDFVPDKIKKFFH